VCQNSTHLTSFYTILSQTIQHGELLFGRVIGTRVVSRGTGQCAVRYLSFLFRHGIVGSLVIVVYVDQIFRTAMIVIKPFRVQKWKNYRMIGTWTLVKYRYRWACRHKTS